MHASDDELRRTKFALDDAQLIVARRHGLESCPKFAKHVETISSANSGQTCGQRHHASIIEFENFSSVRPRLRHGMTNAHAAPVHALCNGT
jgi:hypothetical protein